MTGVSYKMKITNFFKILELKHWIVASTVVQTKELGKEWLSRRAALAFTIEGGRKRDLRRWAEESRRLRWLSWEEWHRGI
ncbi:hypothetical protein MA16_Dca001310 [Dendrobium catenatum]|uniref:Uncharacterized protein n=1 Tax=Dendrobium catenatum TaxID=906689 RepID=A0A2I0WM18_9ASPA|nr:hypothetical protein MA16_Dca001310 [Dendrobium catenatum]